MPRKSKTQRATGTKIVPMIPSNPVQPKASKPKRRRVRKKNPQVGSGMRVVRSSGTDLMSLVETGNITAAAGEVLCILPLGPLHLHGSRLHAEGLLYARWRPTALRVSVAGSAGFGVSGTVVAAWTPDSTIHFGHTKGIGNVRRVMALVPSVSMRLNETISFSIPCETSRKWYMMGGPVDDTAHGCVVLIATSTLGGFTGRITIPVTLGWSVEFEGMEMPEATDSRFELRPDSGWSSLFTTSDGSYSSSVLTFKMTSGGSMAPFSSSSAGDVYTTIGTSTSVYYNTSTSKGKQCLYFSRVLDYKTPGLLLHASLADARAYQTTGDTAKCLPYVSAGSVCTPAIPVFLLVEDDTVSHEIQRLEKRLAELKLALPSAEPATPVPSRTVSESSDFHLVLPPDTAQT